MAHHAKFGTEHDSEFLNFIVPYRFWLAFLPFAAFMNVTDFVIHRPPAYTPSRLISSLLSLVYQGVYAYFIFRSFGWTFTLLTMLVVTPHAGFYLDRLRQFTEHNLMPLDNRNGARSFGIGFWGLLIGGGPWGQPCHWVHHLAPSIPWYQQISLHFYLKRLLTKRQRQQFLLAPFIGYPRLLWRLVRDTNTFAGRRDAFEAAAGQN
jgi:fatty acid desaturase